MAPDKSPPNPSDANPSDANPSGGRQGGASRRDFLAAATLTAAGGALASTARAATNAAGSFEGFGDREIRIGLIGCGNRGAGAIANLLHTPGRIKLVAVADAFDYRIDNSLQQLQKLAVSEAESKGQRPTDLIDVPADRRWAGLDAYQRVLETDCDLVVQATPPGFRPEHVEAAVDAGKHVFLEKPVATDAPGVRRILAAGAKAAQRGLAVQVGLQRRHERKYQETIARLHDGAIGDLVYTRVYWNSSGVWVRPRKSDQTEVEYQVDNWFYFTWLCGDHIAEQHIHNLDVANWLKQATPVEAQGQGGRQVRTGKEYGQIFDHHSVEFTYEDGSKLFSQCRHQPDCWSHQGEYVHGARGTAALHQGRIFGPDGKLIYRYKPRSGEASGHQQEQTNLIADLRAGRLPNEAEYGAHSTMTAIMGRMATYSGKTIRWDEAIASELRLVPDGLAWDSEAPVLPDAEGRYPVPQPGKTVAL